MADSGGVAALLMFMRSCNRSKPHMEMLRHALAILHNICHWRDLLPAVLASPDCVAVLSERLQMFRDTEVGGGCSNVPCIHMYVALDECGLAPCYWSAETCINT